MGHYRVMVGFKQLLLAVFNHFMLKFAVRSAHFDDSQQNNKCHEEVSAFSRVVETRSTTGQLKGTDLIFNTGIIFCGVELFVRSENLFEDPGHAEENRYENDHFQAGR